MKNFRIILLLVVVFATTAVQVAAQEPNFGRAMVMTESELVIGQPVNWYGPGAVYVYRLDAAGQWRERSRFMASDSARMDDFGRTLALDRNTLIVGAPRKRNGTGVAYVFQRAAANADWRQAGIIEPPAAGDHSEYGSALALSGDDLLIGAPQVDSSGVIYHYRRARGAWTLHKTIKPSVPFRDGSFGRTISVRGEWLLVGAPASDSARGKVFFSRRQQNGDWGEARLADLSPEPAVRALAGSSVLLGDNVAYVGAAGAARVYLLKPGSAGSWSVSAQMQPSGDARGSQFGQAVATVGREVWVGAPGVNAGNGRVYRFTSVTDTVQKPLLLDADSADGTHWPFAFGYALASAGNRAVVSMPQRDFGEGRALVVMRQGDAWQPRQLLEGEIYAIGRNATPAARCENGKVSAFTCNNVELVSHVPISALGGDRGVWVNDVWAGPIQPRIATTHWLLAGMAHRSSMSQIPPRRVSSVRWHARRGRHRRCGAASR